MHSLTRGEHTHVMKLTAQMPPVARSEKRVTFEFQQADGSWSAPIRGSIDSFARVARFRWDVWDGSRDTPYRVKHTTQPDGAHVYEGVIRKDPGMSGETVVAGFTGNVDCLSQQ